MDTPRTPGKFPCVLCNPPPHPGLPSLQTRGTTSQLSIAGDDFAFSRLSYKRNRTVCSQFRRASIAQHNYSEIQSCSRVGANHSFCCRRAHIRLHGEDKLCLCVDWLMVIWFVSSFQRLRTERLSLCVTHGYLWADVFTGHQ